MKARSDDTEGVTDVVGTGRVLSAAAAATLGVVLLAGSGGSLAGWSDVRPVSTSAVTAGRISATSTAPTYVLTRTDLTANATAMSDTTTSTATTSDPSAWRLVPGDTVTVSTVVTLTMQGRNARATLAVSPAALTGDAALTGELNANDATTATLTPLGGAGAPTRTGTNTWSVSAGADGVSYQLTVTLTVRPTTNGAAPSPTIPTSTATGNWWGATLQSLNVGARTIAVTLTQAL